MGGHGAYTSGYLIVKNISKFFFYLGGKGTAAGPSTYNGGGKGTYGWPNSQRKQQSGSGGGATDMRLILGSWKNLESLKSRIMVAAGGSGSQDHSADYLGVPGGALTGFEGFKQGVHIYGETLTKSTPPTQTNPGKGAISSHNASRSGTDGGFGYGGHQISGEWGAGAGSGYYGGGGGGWIAGITCTGSSGSSFISGHYGCNAIAKNYNETNMNHTNQPIHYSGIYFKETVMKNGYESFRSAYDTKEKVIGHVGSGAARITIVPFIYPNNISCAQNYSFLIYIKYFIVSVMITMETY